MMFLYRKYVDYVFWMLSIISSILRYDKDVYVFWDYESESMIWDVLMCF